MSDHDLLVLGGGTGNLVVNAAADEGFDVGLIEKGPLGGTCLNRGCNPSKKLIHRANVIETIGTASELGIEVKIRDIDYERIVSEVNSVIDETAEAKAERAQEDDNISHYDSSGRFVDDSTVEVEDYGRVTAPTIVLAGGSRPLIPDSIDGVDETPFLTSDDALRLKKLPERLIIVGGGYIAVEMSHYFSQMGSTVTIVGRGEVLLGNADHEISDHITDVYAKKHDLFLGYTVNEIDKGSGEKIVIAENEESDEIEASGDELLLATGRQPNTDLWNVEVTDIETNDKGFVVTDEYLQTTVDDIYAIGDIAGNFMFKHSGDKEAEYVVETVVFDNPQPIEYPGMAYAVFGSPQVGSLGLTEIELETEGTAYETGTFKYAKSALGSEMNHAGGFVKVLVGKNDEVLGCHVIGPEAATLIHEVSTAVAAGADATTIAETIHVHPALSEVVNGAFRDVRDVMPVGI